MKCVVTIERSNENESFSRNIKYSVPHKITKNNPFTKLDTSHLFIPSYVKLADVAAFYVMSLCLKQPN